MFHSVAILGKHSRPDIQQLAFSMRDWLRLRSITVHICGNSPDDPQSARQLESADLVVVLGGDGTIVSAARRLAAMPKPILGVNFGRVGFLAEIQPDMWQDAFTRIFLDAACPAESVHPVRMEYCMGFSYVMTREGATICSGLAVNDIVVTRGGLARLGTLDLEVGGASLGLLRADGLIVSTPMGTTGYTGSARGPLLQPTLNVYAVTAICPFQRNFLPLVLDGATPLSVKVHEAGTELFMTVDGQVCFPMHEGDVLSLAGVPAAVCFIRIDGVGYFDKLVSSGFI